MAKLFTICICMLIFTVGSQEIEVEQMVGCFADNVASRDLAGARIDNRQMTHGKCRTFCLVKGFKFAGTQYGNQCFCGNSYGTYNRSDACTMTCSGDLSQACGGRSANTVMRTGNVPASVSISPTNQTIFHHGDTLTCDIPHSNLLLRWDPPINWDSPVYYDRVLTIDICNVTQDTSLHVESPLVASLDCCLMDKSITSRNITVTFTAQDIRENCETEVGCFADTESRDLSGASTSNSLMTHGKCRIYCLLKGFKFAGTQYSNQCFCGNSYGTYNRSDACTMTCSGDLNQTCGGRSANTVMRTGNVPVSVSISPTNQTIFHHGDTLTCDIPHSNLLLVWDPPIDWDSPVYYDRVLTIDICNITHVEPPLAASLDCCLMDKRITSRKIVVAFTAKDIRENCGTADMSMYMYITIGICIFVITVIAVSCATVKRCAKQPNAPLKNPSMDVFYNEACGGSRNPYDTLPETYDKIDNEPAAGSRIYGPYDDVDEIVAAANERVVSSISEAVADEPDQTTILVDEQPPSESQYRSTPYQGLLQQKRGLPAPPTVYTVLDMESARLMEPQVTAEPAENALWSEFQPYEGLQEQTRELTDAHTAVYRQLNTDRHTD